MSRHSKRTLILLCAVILCICVIIGFTLQNAEESAHTSGSVLRILLRALYPGYRDMTATEQSKIAAGFQHLIRKLAHFGEYCVLGALLALFWRTLKVIKHPLPFALINGLIVAATDEFIQNFVPGRGPMIRDVLIDFGGVCTGALAAVLIVHAISKRKRQKN